jgi:acyl-CoA synthetase (AMP-forming)/AMP-acid ligase II
MTPGAPLLDRVSDYISWHAARQPDAIALALRGVEITYSQLERRIDDLARALLAAGVRKGDRVATLQTPHPDYVVAFLASASIGAVWLGLNPRYQPAELRRAVRHAEPCVLLTRTLIDERRYEIADLTGGGPELSCRIVAFPDDPPMTGAEPMETFIANGRNVDDATLRGARRACGGRDACLIVYTSGSSGTPKGALLHHAGIGTVSRAQAASWAVDPYRIVNYFPINHIGCVVDCTMPCLIAGGTVYFMEHFDARECLQLMVTHRVTIWGSVPSAFQLQCELDGFEQFDLSAVQLVAWGGASMPEPLINRLRRICPRLSTNYGMTESCGTITSVDPTGDEEVLAHSVGFASPGIEIRLADDNGKEVAPGMHGEVQIRSTCNLLGYWRRDSREAFTPDGFLRTGDLAQRRADGRYRLVGRLSDMYKSGGYNIYPREVEAALESHPAVSLAAVVSVADPLWDEVGVAYVVAAAPVTAAQLADHCRTQLAAYKVPKRILLVGDLPLLPIGKVDKSALRARANTLST